jgi:hypothetical protein
MLWTNDLNQTIAFYCDLLGFECINRMEGWALLRKDSVELMLSLPNAHEPFDKIQFTGSFYFHPDEVDELWRQIKDKAWLSIPLRISILGCASSPFATTTAKFCSSDRKSDWLLVGQMGSSYHSPHASEYNRGL